jgi:hydrogenase nickel incorporation protein HypA/HybF
MFRRNNVESIRSILKKALAQAREAGAMQVKEVRLAIGELAALDQEAIRSQWLELSKDTPGEQAQLYFRLIPAEVQCMACFQKYHPEGGEIHCPHCGSFGAKILTGEEFYLESIE